MISILHPLAAATLVLPVSGPVTLDMRWTRAAHARYDALPVAQKRSYVLPEVRVFDKSGRLLMRKFGRGKHNELPGLIDAAIRRGRPIAGPDLAHTLRDLEPSSGMGQARIASGGRHVVVEYWATWCIPCKAVRTELAGWAARQPSDKVLLIRAETDFFAARKPGAPVTHRYFDKDGREIRIPEGGRVVVD